MLERADVVAQHVAGVEVIDRDVEEALDLRAVQVHRQARGRPRRLRCASAQTRARIDTRGSSFLSPLA